MKENRKVAVVLQGRLNSQRVPNKMIRNFAGTSLWQIALDKLKESKVIPFDDIYISAGETELLEPAVDFNVYIRSKESCNATNDPNIPDSLMLLYEWYSGLQEKGYTHVVLLSACNPLLKLKTIESFYKKFTNRELNGMFSVTRKYNYYWDSDGENITDWKGMKLMNTRKIPPVFEGAHCLYGSKISYIEDECWMGDTSPPTPELFEISDLEATDIDTMEDFKIAEVLYKHFRKDE